jgi:N,N-dimethylformamidase
VKKVLGYLDRWSVEPGDGVKVMVSTYGVGHYDAALVRVTCGDDSPAGPGFKEEVAADVAGRFAGRMQPINAGSYGVVPHAPAFDGPGGLTLQAMIYPTTPGKGVQGIITKWREADHSGFALYIDASGCLALRLGDGAGNRIDVSSGQPLSARTWCLSGASYDPRTRTVRLYQAVQASWAPPAALVERRVELPAIGRNNVPLLIAAFGSNENGVVACSHYNGKIELPRLRHRPLKGEEMAASFNDAVPPQLDADVVGAWDFAREPSSDRIVDASANRLHGRLVNLPSRAVKGFAWRGQEFCWTKAPQEYGAIHFHDDDLYDAGWKPDFSFVVPADLKSGVYAVRLRAEDDEFHMPLFVRPPRGTASERLAFLASTATYLAYANYQWPLQEPLAEIKNQAVLVLEKGDVFLQEHPEFGLSTYDKHSDGSGSRYATRLRPVLNMDLKGPAWSFNADTHILDWLEAIRQPFDVITDEDLHAEGVSLLAGYGAVLTGTHPEYWSTAMLEGVRTYLDRGGRLAYLGGNGFYWRCAFHPCWPGAIEVRRAESGARYWIEEPGEYYLQFTGE